MRFYGCGVVGNRRLAEREVAELYARRERWEVDREAHLGAVVADAPVGPGDDWGYMYAYARPVAFDACALRRQIEEDDETLRNELVRATAVVPALTQYQPDLRQLRGWHLYGARGIAIEDALADRRRAIRMTISHEGRRA